jgi:hypothetical protein
MSYYHSHLLQLSTCATRKHLRHLSRNYTKVFMAWIEKWLNTIDAMFIL